MAAEMPLPEMSATMTARDWRSSTMSKKSPPHSRQGTERAATWAQESGGRADGHEAALNFSGDVHFLAVDALAFLGHGELRIIDQRGGISGDGAEEIAVNLGEATGFQAAVEIEESQ